MRLLRPFRSAMPGTLLVVGACAMGVQHAEFVGGTQLFYVTKGDSAPTVVFEAGMGDGLKTWEPVFNDVAEFSRAVAYSRAGYTGNVPHFDKGGRRTADDVARSLKTLLDKADVPGPYVLVGHSVGGMYVLRYAKLYPDDVAGIVLVDGRPKKFTAECEKAGLSLCTPPGLLAAVLPSHVAAELRGLEACDEQTPGPEELGDIPITVMAGTVPQPLAPKGAVPLWLRLQQEFAEEVANGRYVQADGAGHYIHKDKPELVVREIKSVVETVRDRSPGRQSEAP